MASESTDEAFDGRVALLGRVVLTATVLATVLAGRGGGVEGWTAGATRSFGESTT